MKIKCIYVLKAHRDKGDANDKHVKNVEGWTQEGALVQNQAVRHQLQEQLQREDTREEYVELT